MAQPTNTFRRTETLPGGAGDSLPALRPSTYGLAATGPTRSGTPSYYDISLLKPPVWKWEIAGYFFLGGISGGSYMLSRLADIIGGKSRSDLRTAAAGTAFFTSLPCAPLLIHDLGDPKRFHYMLRVFKPSSPMSLGTWTLAGFSAFSTLAAVRELRWAGSGAVARFTGSPVTRFVENSVGVPLALLLIGYTGVLLTCTANPLWCKSLWLGPLFTSSAIANSGSAVGLVLECRGSRDHGSKAFLTDVTTAAHAAELLSLHAYKRERGSLGKPLRQGKYGRWLRMATAGLLASELLKRLPLRGKAKTIASIAGSAAGLAAGLALRTAIVYAGDEAARDPDLARQVTS